MRNDAKREKTIFLPVTVMERMLFITTTDAPVASLTVDAAATVAISPLKDVRMVVSPSFFSHVLEG